MRRPFSRRHSRFVSAGALLAGALIAAGAAGAAQINPASPAGAVSYEYFGLNYANEIQTSSAIGSLVYTGGAGCAGTCVATTALGADPGASLMLDEVPFEGASGGYAQAVVGYFFVPSTSGSVFLHSGDTLPASGAGAEAQATVVVSTAPDELAIDLTNFGTILYQDTDCVNGCQIGIANYTSPLPLPASVELSVTGGVPYYVYESISISGATSAGQLSATADPSITSGTPGLTLAFSSGVGGGVPEPAAWALMTVGVGMVGAALRARRRPAPTLASA